MNPKTEVEIEAVLRGQAENEVLLGVLALIALRREQDIAALTAPPPGGESLREYMAGAVAAHDALAREIRDYATPKPQPKPRQGSV